MLTISPRGAFSGSLVSGRLGSDSSGVSLSSISEVSTTGLLSGLVSIVSEAFLVRCSSPEKPLEGVDKLGGSVPSSMVRIESDSGFQSVIRDESGSISGNSSS